MNHHIYSIWDFMNLLIALQRTLTCVHLPWKPQENPQLCQLINEIKLEEESDTLQGHASSHFAFYSQTLIKSHRCESHVKTFIKKLQENHSYQTLIEDPSLPQSVQNYLKTTHDIIQDSLLTTAAAFTYARENIMSEMLKQLKQKEIKNPTLQAFYLYVNRHIKLDGERHQNMALKMIDHLCKNANDEKEIYLAAKKAILARLTFWDEILIFIKKEI